MKTYKGYELIKEIAEGNIKNGTKIRDNYGEYIIERIEDLNITEIFKIDEDEKTIPDYSYFTDKENEFEIIEDEINIQDIKEIDEEIAYTNIDISTKWNPSEKIIVEQQNKILRAIKQLDNNIKEK